MKNSIQLRVRLPRSQAARWLALPPSIRAKAVALVMASAGNIDLAELAAMRRELTNLGTLINQSLKLSHGSTVNEAALNKCVSLLSSLLK